MVDEPQRFYSPDYEAIKKINDDRVAAVAKTDCENQGGHIEATGCVLPPPPPVYTPPAPIVAPAASGDAKGLIYSHESGNRTDAINPSSGACGLGQALPCSKLPCSLSDYACQDSWFTSAYMIPRYGSWEAAWAYWNCIGLCTNNYGTITKTATWW